MSYSDWDPDELLNFDYGKPVPEERTSTRVERNHMQDLPKKVVRSYDEDVRLYEKLRQESAEEIIRQAKQEAQNEVYEKYTKKKPKQSNNKKRVASTAAKAINKGSKLYKFSKALSLFYILALAAFAVVMVTMNVLPFYMLIALFIVLGLLSFIIMIQLTHNNIKRWAKGLSVTMAIILILFYGVGCAYGLGTLSFLDKTSKNAINNEKKVEAISKEPFNVLITGMDVWGKIDEQGRSDVNMIVTVNPKTETILMTSIPRDYEIHMPDKGFATDKLTHTGFYSVDTTVQSIENLFDCTANYYVKVNFTTIVKFIDAVGGLDFKNEIAFKSAISKYSYDQGMIHVNGHAALYYARERKAFLDGDNHRVQNQQIIFSEMLKKATSSRTMVLSYSKILNELDDYFEMSFSSREIRSLVKMQLAKNPKWKMYKYAVYGGGATMPTYTTGSQAVYVMTQDPTSVANASNLIQAVIDGKKLHKDKETGAVTIVEETEESQDSQDAA